MSRALAGVLSVCVAAPAFAVAPTVIYSEIGTSPTSLVPGLGGALFDSFSRPYASSDGSWWAIRASTDLATAMDDVIILGQGTTGSVIVQEGTQALWSATGDLVGLIDQRISVNNDGHFVFATNLGGSAPTTTDEQIVLYAGSLSLAAAEGDTVPGLPGNAYGISLHSPNLTNGGVIGYAAPSTVGSLGVDDDDFLIYEKMVFAQENVTVPGGAVEAWDNFGIDDFYVSGDGAQWLAAGDLTGDTAADNVVVVNGDVKIREDEALTGTSGPVETIVESFMNSNGDWFARGDYDSQDDWLVYNGAVIATTGDAVPGGEAGETFDDTLFSATFFSMTGDGQGNFVFGATTSNPDPERDAVLIYNGTDVLLRQGDGVDLDGDGLLDDDVFVDVFNNDDAFLTPDGWYYFTADLINGAGDSLGQGYLRVRIPTPGAASLLAIAGLAGLRRRR